EFRRPSGDARSGRSGLFLVTLLAILIALLNMALGGKIAAFVRTVVAPISNVGVRLGADITKNGYFSTRQSLEAQISSLQQQVQAQQLQAAAFAALQQQNTSLASLEHLAETTPGLAAPITSSV